MEVNYMDEMKKVKSSKWVRVEYTWKPDRCSHCKVFGHSVMSCDVKPKLAPSNNIRVGKPRTAVQGGFVDVKHKKNHNVIKKVWNNDSQGFKNSHLEAMEMKDVEMSDEEDVYDIDDQATQSFIANEIVGNGSGEEVQKNGCTWFANGFENCSLEYQKNMQERIKVELKVYVVKMEVEWKFKLSEAEGLDMIIESGDEEIKEALFDIDSSKAASLNRKILGEINATLIALVPKMDTPNKVSNFRPIACCNVLYKCISKILTNRIKNGLNKVVSLNHSAFIPERHIQDNILITQELLKGYNKKNGAKRQGDHISPYLFTLVMEAFNIIMIKKHDLMILCIGDTESLKVVKKSLDDFSRVSGLFSNLSKRTIFFGSISESLKEEMLQILPFKCGKLPMKNKFLSYVGRIASVLSVMQQYWASVYMLPIVVTNEIKKLFKSFLWNPGGSARGKTKAAWKYMCRPKDQGGLGFKPMHKWNEVLLMSQMWKLIVKKEFIWVKFINTVNLKGKSIWEADIERIGDGKSIFVWHDKWCDQGLLDTIINNKDIYDVRMSNETCLADAIEDGRWKWADE
uniref:Uncharacterized protein n=1 Tax=Tanacetum cinerariifolium TaxID=118510 RepID=A0A6L2K3T0_TANCI|nr:hypothetical protein [Tanacetum cinerariifolium]